MFCFHVYDERTAFWCILWRKYTSIFLCNDSFCAAKTLPWFLSHTCAKIRLTILWHCLFVSLWRAHQNWNMNLVSQHISTRAIVHVESFFSMGLIFDQNWNIFHQKCWVGLREKLFTSLCFQITPLMSFKNNGKKDRLGLRQKRTFFRMTAWM